MSELYYQPENEFIGGGQGQTSGFAIDSDSTLSNDSEKVKISLDDPRLDLSSCEMPIEDTAFFD